MHSWEWGACLAAWAQLVLRPLILQIIAVLSPSFAVLVRSVPTREQAFAAPLGIPECHLHIDRRSSWLVHPSDTGQELAALVESPDCVATHLLADPPARRECLM